MKQVNDRKLESVEMLVKKKPIMLLLRLHDHPELSVHRIAMDIDVTYSHASRVLKQFVDDKLVKVEREGRRNKCTFTDEGQKIYNMMNRLKRLL